MPYRGVRLIREKRPKERVATSTRGIELLLWFVRVLAFSRNIQEVDVDCLTRFLWRSKAAGEQRVAFLVAAETQQHQSHIYLLS